MKPDSSLASTVTAVGACLAMTMVLTAAHAQNRVPAHRPGGAAPGFAPVPVSAQACQLTLGQSNIDYGRFTPGELDTIASAGDQRGLLTMGTRTVPVIVTCPSPGTLTLIGRGPSRQDGTWLFADHGALRLRLSNARLDNRPAWFVDELDPQQRHAMIVLKPGRRVVVAGTEGSGSGIALSATLTIEPVVSYQDARVADQRTWQTEIRLEVSTRNDN